MHAGSTLYAHPGSVQGLGRDSETAGDRGQPYDPAMVGGPRVVTSPQERFPEAQAGTV